MTFGRRVKQLGKNARMYTGYAEGKSERQTPSKNFIWSPLSQIIKNVFMNIVTGRGGPRRISILNWMQQGTLSLRMRKRLRFSKPSLLQSLTVDQLSSGYSDLELEHRGGSRVTPHDSGGKSE